MSQPGAMHRARAVLLAIVAGSVIAARASQYLAGGLSRPSAPQVVGLLVCGALWVVFAVYWEVAAANSAATAVTESRGSRAMHLVLYFVAMVLLLIPVPGLRARFLPVSVAIIAFGLAFEATSLALAIWARHTLGRYWSGKVRLAADHELIRSGPYGVVRHPIYSGLFGMCLGTSLVYGEVHALEGLVLLALAYWRKIALEERTLREGFGEAYEAYRAATWALIPGVL